MFRSMLNRWITPRRPIRTRPRSRTLLGMTSLESRLAPAVTAFFSGTTLSVIGDAQDNNIVLSRNAAGAILVNGGAVPIKGGSPSVANTSLIQVFGQGGNDRIELDEANGALPMSNLFGGAGDDTLIGGSSRDLLFGQAGQDNLQGKGGGDFLFGGADNDTLIGGDGDDQVFGESGSDRMVWNPGDDSDLNEGGSGIDTVEVNGGNGSETFTVTANGARVRFDRLNPAPFFIDVGTSEKLVLNANGGDDSFSATGNLSALIQLTVDGGAGNDTIRGGNGADQLFGGDGQDFIDGNQGADVALLGDGDDVFQWDPGDGNDTVEGQGGKDTLVFNGSAIGEMFDVSANGNRVRFTRNIGNISLDIDDIEQLNLNAFGGADQLTVNDLSGTDLVEVNVNLAGAIGGQTGDANADLVIVKGTEGIDIVDVFGGGTSVAVVGLHAQVNITNSEAADTLTINALAGDDGLTATTLPAGVVKLALNGGAGNDRILGSQGADLLIGDEGNDFIYGDNGDDRIEMGAGDDVFQWDPGDGNDTVEGQNGNDRMLVFGSNVDERVNIVANGGRVLFTRDVADVTIDLDDVEEMDFRALGGVDNIVVGDLSGTDMSKIGLDLRGPKGGGDQASDTVTINGTQGADVFGAVGDAGGINVVGLRAFVGIFFQEKANDRLILAGQGGDDVIDATSLEADGIQLSINGGLGADVIRGSEGDDIIIGGDGNDVAFMNIGDDTFVWNPGDDNDTLEGQGGFDRMVFNGANVGEDINIAANGGRVSFSRNVASVLMDLNDVEAIDFDALGGADKIAVGDLSATDVVELNLNLSAFGGGGDAQTDVVSVFGTNGDDVVVVSGDSAGIAVLGLAARVNITGAESANDQLKINSLDGDDIVDASGLGANTIQLVVDGGNGDDVLIGSDGGDILLGGDGDDVLIGGLGFDLLDGGIGSNVVIQ